MGTSPDRTIGVIGAGVSGLFTARRLLEAGVPVEVLERRPGPGGLWSRHEQYGGVYRSAHLISSKHNIELDDFPMPDEFPDFPSHRQVLEHLRDFAAKYELEPHIQYNVQVRRAEPLPDGGWRVELDDGTERRFAGLVVATGHHWEPSVPDIPTDAFDGLVLHSASYDTPEKLAGRRVVVAGLGNTACDIAVDAVYAGATVTMSVRGGNQLLPKYLMGMPTDRLSKDSPLAKITSRLPANMKRALDDRMIRKLAGGPEQFGLPTPTHKLYDRQPLINSLLPYHIGHGDIRVRPPIAELRGSVVRFADGSEEKADVLVWCTGYRVSLPFLDVGTHLHGDERGRPRLWLNMFPAGRGDLAVVGMVDPLGSWTAFDLQAQLAVRHLGNPGVLDVPAPGPGPDDGPDRDWLFKGHAYTAELREQLAAFDRN
ncbi:MAG: NAD(P)-binding domain-containing protein [Actinocatenispora sp.]